MFESLKATQVGPDRFLVLHPRRAYRPTLAEALEFGRQMILEANALAGRADERGRLYQGQQPLTRSELVNGIERRDTRDGTERYHDSMRLSSPAPPSETLEEQTNRVLHKRVADEEFKALPRSKQLLIESNKRLAAERAEAEREAVRSRQDYADLMETVETLDFFLRFDVTQAPYLRDGLQRIRATMFETVDVGAARENLEKLQAVMQGKLAWTDYAPRQAVDTAAQAAEWSLNGKPEGTPWDRPHATRIDGGVEMFTLHKDGRTAYVSAGLMAGKSDEQLAREFFPAEPQQ